MSTTVKQKVQYKLEFNGVGPANTALAKFKQNATGASSGTKNLTQDIFKGNFAANALTKTIGLLVQGLKALQAALVKSALDAADVQEQWNKFRVTMGDNALGVANDIERIAAASNRNKFELMQGAAALQDLIYPMGVARTQAAGMSRDFVALATDLSSFNNIELDEALSALRSGIAGMSRPLRRFGVDVRLTAVNAELLRMGIQGGTAAATEAQRIQAIYNLTMRQSADAQGDAARTAGRARNVMRGFTSDVNEASVAVGQNFLPIIETLTPMLRDQLGKVLPEINDLAAELAESIMKYGPDAIVVIRDVGIFLIQFSKGVLDLTEILADAALYGIKFNQSLNFVGDTANWLINPLGAATGAIFKFVQTYGEAEAALSEWEDAENRAMVSQSAATLVTGLYADAMTGTAEQAAFLINNLEQLESRGAKVEDILNNLRERHESLTHEIEIGNFTIGEYSRKTAELSIEQIDAARSAFKLAVAQETVNLSMGDGTAKARIEELRAYRIELDSLASDLESGTSTSSSSSGSSSSSSSTAQVKPGQSGKEQILRAAALLAAQKQALILQSERETLDELDAVREDKLERSRQFEEDEWTMRLEMTEKYMGSIGDFIVTNFKQNFENIDELFVNMISNWVTEMAKAGFINFFTNLASGGAFGVGKGLAGKMLKK